MVRTRGRLTIYGGPGDGLEGDRPDGDALVAALPQAVLVIDADGRVVSANAGAEVMLNASAIALRQRALGLVLTLSEACLAGLRGDAAFAAFDCLVGTHCGRLCVDLHAVPLADHAGWRLLVLTSRGATDALGARLDRHDGRRSAVGAAAMLAHEIKNPLAGIRGAAQLLEARAGDDDRILTKLIRDEVDRVAALIDRMEAFTDRRPVERRAENIYAVLEHARRVAQAGYGDRIDIDDAYDPSLPPVLVNRDQLVQVLLNLLKNAAEAVESGRRGRVQLATRYRHGVSIATAHGRQTLPIELSVIDDGPGPPPDVAEHLFEPFVTSKSGGGVGGGGRGLGLALVDKLVRDNGGIVQFAREEQPPRTIFRILLPRAQEIAL